MSIKKFIKDQIEGADNVDGTSLTPPRPPEGKCSCSSPLNHVHGCPAYVSYSQPEGKHYGTLEFKKNEDLQYLHNQVVSLQTDLGTKDALLRELVGTLTWVRQTVHQAHHEGPIEGCRKNTCDAVTQSLRRAQAAMKGETK